MLKWTDLPQIKKISLIFVSRCLIHGLRFLRILEAGGLKAGKQKNSRFDHFSWCFSETMFFRFWRHIPLVEWVDAVKFSCTVNNIVFPVLPIISLLFSWKAMLLSSFSDWTSQWKTLQGSTRNSLGFWCLSPSYVQKVRSRPKSIKVVLLRKMRKRKECSPRLDSEKNTISQRTAQCEFPFWLHGNILTLDFHSSLSCIDGHLMQLSREHAFKG